MPRFLQSRKLWAAIVGLILVIVNSVLNNEQIDPDAVTNAILGIVAAYMAATAWEDGQKAKAEVAPTTTIETPASNVTVSATDDTGTPPHVRRTL
jgi:hypothetical protein